MNEDLLTELLATVLSDVDMFQSFCTEVIGLNVEVNSLRISSQKRFSKLAHHLVDSRPDLEARFICDDQRHLILLESKLGSSEGKDQLNRYSDHLQVKRADGYEVCLVYITQYYEPKDIDGDVPFVPVRWHQVFQWMSKFDDTFITQVLKFMEVIGVNNDNRFLAQDIYAIQNMNRLLRMMDECLDEGVDQVMNQCFGRALGWSNRNVQLRDFCRYLKVSEQEGSWVGCGFYQTEDEYPLVSVIYEVSPSYVKRAEVISAMNGFLVDYPDWEGYDLDDDEAWVGICADVPLLDFLSEENHLQAIQDWFINRLKELHTIKLKYPGLGWKKYT